MYGRNTYGKSTLGDIFASIPGNQAPLLTSRMTIPHDGSSQHIALSFLPPSSTKEVSYSFENGSWKGSFPAGLGIRAFDDGFIHRNVFIGREFSRETKENFSAFVLGEQGVQRVKTIAEKRQLRNKASRERNQLTRTVFGDVGNLDAFLKLKPNGTIQESEKELQNLLSDHADIKRRQKQCQEIQARKEGNVLSWNSQFSDGLKQFNETLSAGLEGAHKEAKAIVAQHISASFQSDQGAEQWVREGIRQNKGEVCQFCGQELSKDANDLLDLYRQAFDKVFEQHESVVNQQLSSALKQANQLPVEELRLSLARNSAIFGSYPELHKNQRYIDTMKDLAELEHKVDEKLRSIDEQFPDTLKRLQEAAASKRLTPNIAFEAISEETLCRLEQDVEKLVSDYNASIKACNEEIIAFKKESNDAALQKRLDKIETEGKAERLNNTRIKLAPQCKEHDDLSEQIKALEKTIDELEKQLSAEQSTYLGTFFESLNEWFKRFGSRDFTLERGENRLGNTPIYFLKVKYKGHPIDESALSQVFSESDRRALALAVFWTQLLSLPEIVLAQQIVVLDDPLTSFDDHRVTAVHTQLAETVSKVRQIIVLSHYRHDIEMFLKTFLGHQDVRLLTLVAGGDNGTEIKVGDPHEFILSEQQKAYERLSAFADGAINHASFTDLRIFFEAELNSRFAAQLAQHGLKALALGEKIDKLFEYGVIEESVRNKCHNFRIVLNPSHHIWTEADIEDQRNTVRDFLNFVYNNLVRHQ